MSATKSKKAKQRKAADASPVTMLESELLLLRRDLRQTVKAYALGLENELRTSLETVGALGPAEDLSREHLHSLRDATILLRKRKLKPEKGRRKDLRKIDSLIEDLQMLVTSDLRS